MFIGKVVGTVWATRKHKSLNDLRLLLVCPFDPVSKQIIGPPQLAVDKKFQAGLFNIVLVIDEGNSARQILEDRVAPIRTIICGIVDSVTVNGKIIKFH